MIKNAFACFFRGHSYKIVGTRLHCKRCSKTQVPDPEDVTIYYRSRFGLELCDEHSWVQTSGGLGLMDLICKDCSEILRDVEPSRAKELLWGDYLIDRVKPGEK